MQLEDSVCIVTGATGGIGRALILALADAGAKLIPSARSPDALSALGRALPATCLAAVHTGDLTTPSARESLARLGADCGANVLINVCGGNRFGLLEEQSQDDVSSLLTVNLMVPIDLTRRLLPHLANQHAAMVVNVGSTFGTIGYPGYVLYSASKFGLRGFSEALARELADGPVEVVHVDPRATRTAMNSAAVSAMNRTLGNTEDPAELVARRIVKAMERGRRRSAIGWPERFFTRINRTWPGLVDRALAGQLATIKQYAAARPATVQDPVPTGKGATS